MFPALYVSFPSAVLSSEVSLLISLYSTTWTSNHRIHPCRFKWALRTWIFPSSLHTTPTASWGHTFSTTLLPDSANKAHYSRRPKTLEYRTGRNPLFTLFFQASSGIRMDQNKGFLPVLYSTVFGIANSLILTYIVQKWYQSWETVKVSKEFIGC